MKKIEIELKWSVIYAISYLVWMFFERFLGFHFDKANAEPLFNLLFIPIAVILYILAIKEKKKKYYNGQMDWKQGFGSGIVLSFFIALTSSIIVYITFTILSPEFFEKAIAMSKDQELAKINYNIQAFVKNNIFDKLSFGVVFAAIISYFSKTKPL
ncbi:DUF4199 domain-containing protein [Flavobacterium sp. NRK F10]|uniref:DUF4199 domain-containing protein n=1 Tax=Flavobacterium sp. NRK F10 TaxID=2954931 RepID=UPI002091A096|nr:DUF4199 domain-containing protein [Flavobacterium sp. NRK F10]MCO6176457.1 DUF4199 domain-containing protein [Flavobacterium sp. NRK F10]